MSTTLICNADPILPRMNDATSGVIGAHLYAPEPAQQEQPLALAAEPQAPLWQIMNMRVKLP
ncbi:hypothetical protein [Sodaliphilus pleomorphus]|uniref:hypothetical protein n=1 Tax=Sodaliphilus pleomorphus TaxID=2606626 RepID=UPI00240A2BBC|nr:hypothetical protein [Sodaliphilus pleomorphus]MDD6687557.1 hypothetical protein [Sodaliphilus pleomorphus]